MGSSSWNDEYYKDREDVRVKENKSAFVYDSAMKSTPHASRVVNDKMDPKGVRRESRDSDAHPDSVAVGVIFDVTGSMGGIPVRLQKKLPQLMGLLTRKNYLAHPQILFGAVGDFFADRVPLQMGQFESGIEMDDDLGRLYLEGGGGGTMEESYQNAMLFFGRNTSIDCFEKRGKQGYLFLIGDEKPYSRSTKEEVLSILGTDVKDSVPIEEIVAEAREKYNVFFVIPKGASHGLDPSVKKRWTEVLGEQNVLMLDDPEGICEVIALAIGMCEGTVDLGDGATHLKDSGTDVGVINSVTRALDPLSKGVSLSRVGTGNLPEKVSSNDKVVRL